MDMTFFIYLITAVVAIFVLYVGVRWVDYRFTIKETSYSGYVSRINDKGRAKLAKSCIQSFTSGQKQMAKELCHELTENLLKQFKEFGDL